MTAQQDDAAMVVRALEIAASNYVVPGNVVEALAAARRIAQQAPATLPSAIDDALETMELAGMHGEQSYKTLKALHLAQQAGAQEPVAWVWWSKSEGCAVGPKDGSMVAWVATIEEAQAICKAVNAAPVAAMEERREAMGEPWHTGFHNEIADNLREGSHQSEMVRYKAVNVCAVDGQHVAWAASMELAAVIVAAVNRSASMNNCETKA